MSDYPNSVRIIEVGPRDGLQIEARILSVDEKLDLVSALLRAGLKEIEVGSFVNPKAVPQMAATGELVRRLPEAGEGVQYRALWLNARGLEQAIESGRVAIDGKLSLTASEPFVLRNTNRTIAQALADIPDWIARYDAAGVKTRALGMMAAFGCNFAGDIPMATVLSLIARVVDILEERGSRLERLSLADTMGWANPSQVQRMIGAVRNQWPDIEIKLHLHDTRGSAMANALAAMQLGVREFDAAIGGMGGCPFAGHRGAAGNICTEDLVFTCEEMGIGTGIDLDALVEAANLAERLVGHGLPGKVMKGGTLSRFRLPAYAPSAAINCD